MTTEKPEPDSVEPVPDGVPDDIRPTRPRPSAKGRVVGGLAGLVSIALLASLVILTLSMRADSDEDSRSKAALSVASHQALTLLGITDQNVDDRLKTLLDNSTGEFQRQLGGIQTTFGSVVKKGKVKSTGRVLSSGIVRIGDSDARVLMALDSEVTNTETKTPELRRYRITVDLERKGDRWLVSGMQFAP